MCVCVCVRVRVRVCCVVFCAHVMFCGRKLFFFFFLSRLRLRSLRSDAVLRSYAVFLSLGIIPCVVIIVDDDVFDGAAVDVAVAVVARR